VRACVCVCECVCDGLTQTITHKYFVVNFSCVSSPFLGSILQFVAVCCDMLLCGSCRVV